MIRHRGWRSYRCSERCGTSPPYTVERCIMVWGGGGSLSQLNFTSRRRRGMKSVRFPRSSESLHTKVFKPQSVLTPALLTPNDNSDLQPETQRFSLKPLTQLFFCVFQGQPGECNCIVPVHTGIGGPVSTRNFTVLAKQKRIPNVSPCSTSGSALT